MIRTVLVLGLIIQTCSPVLATEPHSALPSPGVIDGLGVNIHFTDPQPGEMEMLSEGGFRWVRMDFTWARTERERGRYDFSPYERLLSSLDKHNMRALFILDYSNKLYEPERSVASAAGREAYARWAAAAAKHFQGRGVVWEIWNEPNIRGFWHPEPNLDHYTAMAIAACRAIRAVAPQEAIVGPATSQIDLEFLEGCCQAGLLEQWDAVSVHPYRQQAPETVFTEYRKLQRLIEQYAPAGKSIPILSGEWGYSAAWNSYDNVQQGRLLPRQWLCNMAAGVPISIWYDWHDDGRDPKEAEHNFGTVANAYRAGQSPVYEPKPAYQAARTLTRLLDGYRFIKRIRVGSPDDFAMLFSQGDKLCVAAWTTNSERHSIVLPANDAVFRRVTHVGQREADVRAADGSLTLTVDTAPRYLIADRPNPLLAAAPEAHALHVTVKPVLDRVLTVGVSDTMGKPFSGRVQLTQVTGIAPTETTAPLTLDGDHDEAELRFPLAQQPATSYQAGVQILDTQGHPVLTVSPQRVRPLPGEMLTDARVVADGDREVVCEYTRTVSAPPEPLSGLKGSVVKLTYKFGEGWRFLRLAVEGPPEIDGQPKSLGLWVYGDGHGCSPRLRVVDSGGQMWQPTGMSINWTGWRYIEMPFSGSAGHWGGDENNQLDLPLRWDTIFLLDNPSRKALEGEVYLAAPHLLY